MKKAAIILSVLAVILNVECSSLRNNTTNNKDYLSGVQSDTTKIVYVFPDSVEVAVHEYITQKKWIRSYKPSYYLLLEKDTADVYRLVVLHYEPSYNPTHRANRSNRVAVINDKRLPLIFDYDELFGTVDAVNIGKFGERNEGYVKRSITIYEWPYTIYFIGGYNKGRNYGKIIKRGYY